MSDRFYDYATFSDDRVSEIFKAWDGLGGYHGLLIKQMSYMVIPFVSVLDVGCGAMHLMDAIKWLNVPIKEYVGVEKDDRIIVMAKVRYPDANIVKQDLYSLDLGRRFDAVYACGLYSGEPKNPEGIKRLLDHTERYLVLTYFAEEKGSVPDVLKVDGWTPEFILHEIDERLEIMRLWRII